MPRTTRPTSAALTHMLLAYEETLPPALVEALVAAQTQSATEANTPLEALLDRRELTTAQVEQLADSVARLRYCGDTLHGKLLARLPVRPGDGAAEHLRRVRTSVRNATALAHTVISSPIVRDDVLDAFEAADSPLLLAQYARHTPRGAGARQRALARLESVLGPTRKRLNEVITDAAAAALAQLLAQDPQAGRAQLLATHTRPVLLALGMNDQPWQPAETFALLDAASRAHLIEHAVLPVFLEAKPTLKDEDRAVTLVHRLKNDLDVEVLRHLVPALPSRHKRLRAEIAAMCASSFNPAKWDVFGVAYGPGSKPIPGSVQWLLDTLEPAAATLGWTTLLQLADPACTEETPLLDLSTVIHGVAAPTAADNVEDLAASA